jgi:hypothetical protein
LDAGLGTTLAETDGDVDAEESKKIANILDEELSRLNNFSHQIESSGRELTANFAVEVKPWLSKVKEYEETNGLKESIKAIEKRIIEFQKACINLIISCFFVTNEINTGSDQL